MSYRQIATNTAVVFAILVGALLLWEFRQALAIFLFSLAVAAAIRPLVERWAKNGLSRAAALALVYLVIMAVLVLFALLVGSSLLSELQKVSDNLALWYDQIWRVWPKGTEVQKWIIQQLPAPGDLYESFSIDRQNSTTQALLGVTLNSFGLFSNLFAVVFLSFYWSLDQIHFERLWLSLFPVESRARYRDMWRDIERDLGTYIRSEMLQSLFAGLILGVGFNLIGLPYPTLLTVFGALVWLIPWLGGVLAVLPVALVGLSTNLWLGIAAAGFTIATLFFLEFVIEPRFLRQRQYSSLLSILMILALSEPFGLMGFLIAPPLAAAIELAFRYSIENRVTSISIESLQRIAGLRSRIAHVRDMMANTETSPEPQTVNMLERLEALIERADNAVEQKNQKTTR